MFYYGSKQNFYKYKIAFIKWEQNYWWADGTYRIDNYINVVMISNSKLMKNRKHRLNTNRQRTSFSKLKVENADLDKPVLKK